MTDTPEAPRRAGIVLTALILAALVCNINLAAANIALPDIGRTFGATQTALTIVGLGCSLGLAMSVLYFGALADRYGRKQLLMLGLSLTIVASLCSTFSVSIDMLIASRIFTGIAAGMAFPTTLSLITALWANGPRRTRAIALWSGVSAMSAVIGSVIAGYVLTLFWWGSAFLIAVPIAAAGLVLVAIFVPAHVAESADPVDHVGGVLATLAIAGVVLGIGTVFSPGLHVSGGILLAVGVLFLVAFVVRQQRGTHPLYDLRIARRRMFWAPAAGGTIVFGSLMGAMFVGQQYLQNILGYSTLEAGLAVVPAAVGLLLLAPLSARLVTARGSRVTMLLGYALVFCGFIATLFWNETTPYPVIGLGFLLIGSGSAFAMTPASRALTESTPVQRVGMASATSDLQRDLGGSVMQALLGAILAAGFAISFGRQIAASPEAAQVSDDVTQALQASYGSALQVADQYPQYRTEILEGATQSLLSGAWGAYVVGAVAVLIGAAVVGFGLPSFGREKELVAQYEREDAASRPSATV